PRCQRLMKSACICSVRPAEWVPDDGGTPAPGADLPIAYLRYPPLRRTGHGARSLRQGDDTVDCGRIGAGGGRDNESLVQNPAPQPPPRSGEGEKKDGLSPPLRFGEGAGVSGGGCSGSPSLTALFRALG